MKLQFKIEELKKMTKKELYEIAKKLKIKGRSKMKKRELLESIKRELALVRSSAKEESVTSNFIPQEPIKEEKKEVKLPTYEEEFLSLIPVNPELSLAVWNAFGGKGKLRLKAEGKEVFETEVNLNWRNYYLHFRAPFEKLQAELEVKRDGKTHILKSNVIVAPSDEVTVEVEERKTPLMRGFPKIFATPIGYGDRNG
jgi:septin family protein